METAATILGLQLPLFCASPAIAPTCFTKTNQYYRRKNSPLWLRPKIKIICCNIKNISSGSKSPNPKTDDIADKKPSLQESSDGMKILETLRVVFSEDDKSQSLKSVDLEKIGALNQTIQALYQPNSFAWYSLPLQVLRLGYRGPDPKIVALVMIAMVATFTTVMFKIRNGKKNQEKAEENVKFQRSLSMATLRGGKPALQCFIIAQQALVEPDILTNAKYQFGKLLEDDLPNFEQLQREALRLEMIGEEEDGSRMLKAAWERLHKERKDEEAYQLEMLLVELLIYQIQRSISPRLP
ncbi:uncharacterized protein LOC18430549 isoform X2 [Amborella trichopoda]|uniref:uncharacterized protein LOC18430549 isoform X2 n=1 Tax=Amborella trichopoda TaxID=13333 RepID=UPI0009BEB316|nr:uncharacterized protein LOC18430549 isoform X2 [Amborella trichopoda]|eukprot:XP_020520718.1 uncharacterized protein LOC18430549 isoform X2 [Amborella trichopoda]